MDIQNVFYFVGTVFMIMMIILIIGFGIFLYKIRENLALLSKLTHRPAATATELGAGIAEGVALKIKEWTSKKASN